MVYPVRSVFHMEGDAGKFQSSGNTSQERGRGARKSPGLGEGMTVVVIPRMRAWLNSLRHLGQLF